MKKVIKLTLILLLASILAVACQKQNTEENSIMKKASKEATEISIFNSNGFNKESSSLIASYTDKETINTLLEAINSATKEEGVVNMAEANYNLRVTYKGNDREELYLWLEEGQIGALMKVEDTHTIYSLSKEMSKTLYDLLQLNRN